MAIEIVSHLSAERNDPAPASLWETWWQAICLLRPAFARLQSFLWFATIVAGMTIRSEHLGVTSIVRVLKLLPGTYDTLLKHFHRNGVCLNALAAQWMQAVLRLFPQPVRVNGRIVLVGDGIKVAKYGKNMPGVKLLHQQAEHKAEWIMGHSFQAVSILVHAAESVLAVPLAVRIHEGIVRSNRDKKTLLDKMLALIGLLEIHEPMYFVADAYYAAGKMIAGLRKNNSHLITRLKSNAVAFERHQQDGARGRGRPRIYGEKIAVTDLFAHAHHVAKAQSPLYGEKNVTLRFAVADLLWRSSGELVRLVAVEHPHHGLCVLLCTDVTLDGLEIIRLYGLRFKIEHGFKQAVHVIGTFAYHFWMQAMKPLKHGDGDQYLHRESQQYRTAIDRTLHAYHVFLAAGVIAQGLLQYLSVTTPKLVWHAFGSWLRTVRPGIAPSEFVTAEALRQSLPYFLVSSVETHNFAKFITVRQDPHAAEMYRMAG